MQQTRKTAKLPGSAKPVDHEADGIVYIRQMLGELRRVADEQGADMLCYLIEMAYEEAGDVLSGRRPRSIVLGGG
ncbi:hypothetical protein ACU5AY_09865 [Rhizobium sp. PAMB 3174]